MGEPRADCESDVRPPPGGGRPARSGVPGSVNQRLRALAPLTESLPVNVVLLTIFALQHSVIARPQFKAWWTRFVPKSVERSIYVVLATSALTLLLSKWWPIPDVIWQIGNSELARIVIGISHFGWLVVLTSTFLINHFALFGLRMTRAALLRRQTLMPCMRPRLPPACHSPYDARSAVARTGPGACRTCAGRPLPVVRCLFRAGSGFTRNACFPPISAVPSSAQPHRR